MVVVVVECGEHCVKWNECSDMCMSMSMSMEEEEEVNDSLSVFAFEGRQTCMNRRQVA